MLVPGPKVSTTTETKPLALATSTHSIMSVSSCQPLPTSTTQGSTANSTNSTYLRSIKTCFKYPSLDDILQNRSAQPYSLSSFIGFLAHNHCLETLEFTLDVAKYADHFQSADTSPESLNIMWRSIIDTYIRTDSPKELNLPAEVKASLTLATKPSPVLFHAAVDMVKDMMKENAYLSFINYAKYTKLTSQYTGKPDSCLINCHSSLISPFDSHESAKITKTSSSEWHQPASWNSLSSFSSSDSLYPGDEAGVCTKPMTPPQSPKHLDHKVLQKQVPQPPKQQPPASLPRQHSHWRKMSQRLKWRRSSDKTSSSTTA